MSFHKHPDFTFECFIVHRVAQKYCKKKKHKQVLETAAVAKSISAIQFLLPMIRVCKQVNSNFFCFTFWCSSYLPNNIQLHVKYIVDMSLHINCSCFCASAHFHLSYSNCDVLLNLICYVTCIVLYYNCACVILVPLRWHSTLVFWGWQTWKSMLIDSSPS